MEALLVIAGGLIGVAGSIIAEWVRRTSAKEQRAEERVERQRVADRERYEEIYRLAAARLLDTQSALHRLYLAIRLHEQAHYHQPYSPKGTVDWLVSAVDDMRTARPLLALFASTNVTAGYDAALEIATEIREGVDEIEDWDLSWHENRLEEFDGHSAAALGGMRSDLESVREQPALS